MRGTARRRATGMAAKQQGDAMNETVSPVTEARGAPPDAAPPHPGWYATLFSHGFLPFFLVAGLYAALGLAAWTAWIAIHAAGGAPRLRWRHRV